MKKILVLIFLLGSAKIGAQETPVATAVSPVASPSGVVSVMAKWDVSKAPWDAWFKDNALVTDKTDYVHFFWNAQDFRGNFEVKDKKLRLAEAALELVRRLYPADAKADQVKVDIVYVLERDTYGQPKWDSLQQVAHLEFLKSKLPKKKSALTAASMGRIFDKFELF